MEYPVFAGYKIFYGIVGIGLISFGLFLFTTPHYGTSQFVLLLPVLLITFGCLIVWNQFKRKVVISDSSITYTWIFRTVKMSFGDIKGYRIGYKRISIESQTEDGPKIIIDDYNSLSKTDSLKAWLKDNFKDLNIPDYQ